MYETKQEREEGRKAIFGALYLALLCLVAFTMSVAGLIPFLKFLATFALLIALTTLTDKIIGTKLMDLIRTFLS